MIYKNKKTGAVIDSSCKISGGDWVEVKPTPKPAPKKEPVKKAVK